MFISQNFRFVLSVFFQKCTILLLIIIELVFLIYVLIIPDVLEDARSVSDQTVVFGTAVKEGLSRMTGRRTLGNFKQTKKASFGIVDHWTQKHFTLFNTLRWTNDIKLAEVYSCAFSGRAIHVCALTFGWLLDPKC